MVGEYEIVILSAKDSGGLEAWLHANRYSIPKGSSALLQPYVSTGSKFFVAKVNTTKVAFENGMANLSPLRFHYDAKQFSLPIRLGLMNSKGTQDLIVHILSPGKRFEVANYNNVTIPTNLDLKDNALNRFGEFYAALFDRTLAKNPNSVVTEYAWDAATCDPCPSPPLRHSELATLGADVLSLPRTGRSAKPNRDARSARASCSASTAVPPTNVRLDPPACSLRKRPARRPAVPRGTCHCWWT